MQKNTSLSLPLILLAMLALLTGLWAGLLRLGWQLGGNSASLALEHGPLMVSGFLGSLIILERVVALNRRWMFLAPLLSGLGWVALLLLPGVSIGAFLIAAGSLLAVFILGVMFRREPTLHTLTMLIGVLCWLVGNLLWLVGQPVFQVVFWWMGFLVLTIAGERLELSRVLRPTTRTRVLFSLAGGLFLLGIMLSAWQAAIGARMVGAGLAALCLWLVRYDIARRNLRHPMPLTRYIATCLFIGTLWLGVSGLLSLWFGFTAAGPAYDAVLHSLFIGFVISMIFGHAPIILPALVNISLPFHPAFYLNLILLHASLILRVGADLAGWAEGRQWGGLLNEVAILSFLVMTALSIQREKRKSLRR